MAINGVLLGKRERFGNTNTYFTQVFKGYRWRNAEHMGQLQEETDDNRLLVWISGAESPITELENTPENRFLAIQILLDPIEYSPKLKAVIEFFRKIQQ